jgi:molybdopterin synthase sulfur carrier subunit
MAPPQRQTVTTPRIAMVAPASPPAGAARDLTLRVRLFAGLREAMGWSERQVQAAAGATPLTLWRQLGLAVAWQRASIGGAAEQDPPAGGGGKGSDEASGGAAAADGANGAATSLGEGLPDQIRVAINQQFAAADAALTDGDELAFLPPISGG